MCKTKTISYIWLVSDIKLNNTLIAIPNTETNISGNTSSIRMSQAPLIDSKNNVVGSFYTTEKAFSLINQTYPIYTISRQFTFSFDSLHVPASYFITELFSSSSSLLLENGTYTLKPTSTSGFFANKRKIKITIIATNVDRTVIISYKDKKNI
jgi:hypothetical protein